MNKGVFLDRDGTVIRDVVYLNDPKRIEIFPESYEAIKKLNENGFLVFLVTNQSGVARGYVTEDMVKHINKLLVDEFKSKGALISDCSYCPHPVDGGCECRKPNAGMIKELASKHDVNLSNSWMVGDRMSDVVAGLNAGCRSILLQNDLTPPIDTQFAPAETIKKDILETAQFILAETQHTREKK